MPVIQGAAGLDATAYVIQVDPTVQGFQAPVGAFAYSFLTGGLYLKIGSSATEWIITNANTGANGGLQVPILSAEIDLTVPGDYVLLAPQSRRCPLVQSLGFWITQVGGTRSVAPNIQLGVTASVDDFAVAQAMSAGILTQAANTRLGPFLGSAVSPSPAMDLTTRGFILRINTGMTGTNPVCKGRVHAVAVLG